MEEESEGESRGRYIIISFGPLAQLRHASSPQRTRRSTAAANPRPPIVSQDASDVAEHRSTEYTRQKVKGEKKKKNDSILAILTGSLKYSCSSHDGASSALRLRLTALLRGLQ